MRGGAFGRGRRSVVDLAIGLLAAFTGLVAALCILLLWVGDRTGTAFERSPDPLDPILGPRDRLEIRDSQGPFIPMPPHLKTQDEMVAWMTHDLPKLIAESPRPRV